MKTLVPALVAAVSLGASASAFAMDDMKHGMGMKHGMDMKMMDANGDGMVSKDEYMKYHEAMWAKMKKDKNGMVMMDDMGMMDSGSMQHDRMGKEPMKGDRMKSSPTTEGAAKSGR